MNPAASSKYAGFWVRLAASTVDGAIITLFSLFVSWLSVWVLKNDVIIQLAPWVVLIIASLYYIVPESSPRQATLGKMLLGIKVADLSGNPVSFGRAVGRYFGKIISGILILVGFFMAAFTKKKQALHDMLAGTIVVKSRDTSFVRAFTILVVAFVVSLVATALIIKYFILPKFSGPIAEMVDSR